MSWAPSRPLRWVLALAALVACLLALPAPAGAQGAIPPAYKVVAETAKPRLHLDPVSTRLIVEDKRNGKLWASNPTPGITATTTSIAPDERQNSVFFLFYTDARRAQALFRHAVGAKPDIAVTAAPDGVGVDYQLRDLKLAFRVVYQLVDDHLDVRIPNDHLAESGDMTFVRIEMLPYFGATTGETPGYFVVPEGLGSLIRFRPLQPEYRRRFNAEFYGPASFTFDPKRQGLASDRQFQPRLNMPIFGAVVGEAGYVAILTQGALDAELGIETSFKAGELNRIATQFIVRRAASYPLRRAAFVTKIEVPRIQSERGLRYVFLPGPGASYVDVGRVYRDYLLTERSVPRLPDATYPMHLRLFMGVEKWAFPFSEFFSMTTYDQAIAILAALKQRGVDRLMVTLIGWEQGGYGGRWPTRLPTDDRIAGPAGLRRLAEYARTNDHRLILEDQCLIGLERAGGFLARGDVVRGANRLAMTSPTDRLYQLNSARARDRFVADDVPQLAQLGAAGILVQGIGSLALADYNSQWPLNRQQFVGLWRDVLDDIRSRTGWAGVVGPYDYVLGTVTHLEQVPLDRINHLFFDETVPLQPIALHGLTTYSGIPENLWGDTRQDFLRQLEYGAMPSFELTYQSPAGLEGTVYNDLFSSQYGDWLDAVGERYRLAAGPLGATRNQFIVDHRSLAPEVFATTYEDGTRVVVNYGAKDYQRDGLAVPAHGYAIDRVRR